MTLPDTPRKGTKREHFSHGLRRIRQSLPASLVQRVFEAETRGRRRVTQSVGTTRERHSPPRPQRRPSECCSHGKEHSGPSPTALSLGAERDKGRRRDAGHLGVTPGVHPKQKSSSRPCPRERPCVSWRQGAVYAQLPSKATWAFALAGSTATRNPYGLASWSVCSPRMFVLLLLLLRRR